MPIATDKRYTPEEISSGKYYMMGNEKAYKLINRKNIPVMYPNTILMVYEFEIINIKTGYIEVSDVILNPLYHCFSDVNDNDIKNSIYSLEKHINNLKFIVKC